MTQTYIHYTSYPFRFDKSWKYPKRYRTGEYPVKPFGFWFSCENTEIEHWQNWLKWCLSEQQFLEKLSIRYEMKIEENANILEIRDDIDFIKFSKQYRRKPVPDMYTTFIAWDDVKDTYDGIIISPYMPQFRLKPETVWYNSWDCASGCIWNLDAIKELKRMNNITIHIPGEKIPYATENDGYS